MTDNHKNETTHLKKTTNKLEQLPSSKKRTLNVDSLATPLTHKLDTAESKTEDEFKKTSEKLTTHLEQNFMDSLPETAPHPAVVTATANLASSSDENNTVGTVKFTSTSKDVKEPVKPIKEVKKESSDEVVQEILKEVAKEVERDNIKPTSKTVEKPSSITEEPPTLDMKIKPVESPVSEAKTPTVDKPKEETSLKLEKSKPKTEVSWAEKPLQETPVKAVIPNKEETKEVKQEAKETKETASTKSNVEENTTKNASENESVTDLPPVEMPLFNSINKFSETPTEVKSTGAKIRSFILWTIPIWILLGVFIGIIYIVPNLREKVAEKLPPSLAKTLKLTSKEIAFLSIQEYRYSVDEKEKTVTISGVVKNLTEKAVGPLQLEFQLTKREDVRLTDSKIIPLDPIELGPQKEGKYTFTISAKDYQETKFLRITTTNKDIELKVKKLGIVDPPIDPSKLSEPVVPLPNNKPKQPDNNVYDGSVN
jgi:hypothetical protein